MKLTQGTGRGTCWWNISLKSIFYFFLLFAIQLNIVMESMINFFDSFFNYLDYKVFSIDELLTILLFYNFFKLLVFSSLVELI